MTSPSPSAMWSTRNPLGFFTRGRMLWRNVNHSGSAGLTSKVHPLLDPGEPIGGDAFQRDFGLM